MQFTTVFFLLLLCCWVAAIPSCHAHQRNLQENLDESENSVDAEVNSLAETGTDMGDAADSRNLKKRDNGHIENIPVVEGYVVQDNKRRSHRVGKGHVVQVKEEKLPEAKKEHHPKAKFVEEQHIVTPLGLYAPPIEPVHPVGVVPKSSGSTMAFP